MERFPRRRGHADGWLRTEKDLPGRQEENSPSARGGDAKFPITGE